MPVVVICACPRRPHVRIGSDERKSKSDAYRPRHARLHIRVEIHDDARRLELHEKRNTMVPCVNINRQLASAPTEAKGLTGASSAGPRSHGHAAAIARRIESCKAVKRNATNSASHDGSPQRSDLHMSPPQHACVFPESKSRARRHSGGAVDLARTHTTHNHHARCASTDLVRTRQSTARAGNT